MEPKYTTVPQWNPYMTYTWSMAQVKAWVNLHGPWAFYDGKQWFIQAKPFVGIPGMRYVRFTLKESPDAD